jgi:hypothetical protein
MNERLTAVEQAAARHELWHQDIGTRMLSFEGKLDENTSTTARIEASTTELLELLNSWKGAMKVLGWVARPITLLSTLVASCVALYFTFWPKK